MVRYAEDWFFVLKKDAIDRCDIPDETLRVKGEVAIGLQLLQQKYKIMTFNAGKSLVFTPPAEDNPESAAEQRYPWQGGHHDSVRSQAND